MIIIILLATVVLICGLNLAVKATRNRLKARVAIIATIISAYSCFLAGLFLLT